MVWLKIERIVVFEIGWVSFECLNNDQMCEIIRLSDLFGDVVAGKCIDV